MTEFVINCKCSSALKLLPASFVCNERKYPQNLSSPIHYNSFIHCKVPIGGALALV